MRPALTADEFQHAYHGFSTFSLSEAHQKLAQLRDAGGVEESVVVVGLSFGARMCYWLMPARAAAALPGLGVPVELPEEVAR